MTLVPADQHNGYNQVQPYQPQFPVQQASVVQANQVMRLTEWADEARAAAAIAASLVKTSFVPKAFAGRVEEATAAILTGAEMGLSPMASLRAIYVIHGTPGMYAKTMRAVVQSHGHDIWVHESTASRVIVKGRRKGSDQVESSSWTIDRAKIAGLTANDQYRKNPQNMLMARATAEVCWLIAADALSGIAASVEELESGVEGVEPNPQAEPTPAKRTAKRRPLERMEGAEPSLPPSQATVERVDPAEAPVSAPPADDSAVEMPDQRALAAMFATFNEARITDKDGQLAYIAEEIGRTVGSRKELTAAEVAQITRSLRANVEAAKTAPAGEQS